MRLLILTAMLAASSTASATVKILRHNATGCESLGVIHSVEQDEMELRISDGRWQCVIESHSMGNLDLRLPELARLIERYRNGGGELLIDFSGTRPRVKISF